MKNKTGLAIENEIKKCKILLWKMREINKLLITQFPKQKTKKKKTIKC